MLCQSLARTPILRPATDALREAKYQAVADAHDFPIRYGHALFINGTPWTSRANLPRAMANNDTCGALKIVIDAETRKVLGVHAALDGAGDLILAATYAIKYGLTVENLAQTWAPYLTMAEALRLCARLFASDLPTSCCA